MNDRPPVPKTVEEWMTKYHYVLRPHLTIEDMLVQVQIDRNLSLQERKAIVEEYRNRPEQVAARKRKERLEFFIIMTIAILLASIVIWWTLSGMPINFPS